MLSLRGQALPAVARSLTRTLGLGDWRRSAHALRVHVCPRTPCLDNTEGTSASGQTRYIRSWVHMATGGKPPVTPPNRQDQAGQRCHVDSARGHAEYSVTASWPLLFLCC